MRTRQMHKNVLLSSLLALLSAAYLGLAGAAVPTPAPPATESSGYLLIEMNSGTVLAERDATARLEPASLTKIMSAYTVFRELEAGHIQLSDQVVVSKKAWETPGSRMFIEVNTGVSVEDLLKGMIIQSGNDASVALAEHVAGSEETFAALMNAHAQRLGMQDTHFVNSTGLPHPEHYTTARDIAKVTEATIREFPEFYAWYAIKEFTYNKIKQRNRNRLLWRDDSIDGVKTGHTDAAGYCLVAAAERGDMRLLSAVMGTSSERAREQETQALLNYGFRFFQSHKVYEPGQSLARVRVWKGDTKELGLGIADPAYVTLPRGHYDGLEAVVMLEPTVIAPVADAEALGYLSFRIDGEETSRTPLISLREVALGGLWRRTVDSVLLWFQ